MEIDKLQKCDGCGDMFPVDKAVCMCGWKPHKPVHKKAAISGIVTAYMTEHSLHNATKEQCQEHLRNNGYMSLLPEHLQEK